MIATTNRSLARMVQEGKFRADLYYRLNVIPLSIPPLRERRSDIALMAEHFVRLYAPPGKELSVSPELVERLEEHDWPGNVRELANLMRRAVALSSGPQLGPDALEITADDSNASFADRLEPGLSLVHVEKRLFELTLKATGGNRSRAAEMLGVSLRTVRNKIRDYGLPSGGAMRMSDFSLIGTPVLARLERYLDLSVFRHGLISSNLANIDTPGYRTRDVIFAANFTGQSRDRNMRAWRRRATRTGSAGASRRQ